MKILKTGTSSLIALALLSHTSVKAGDDTSMYAGLFLGQASYDVSKSDLDRAEEGSLDDSDSSMKVIVGYKFNEHFSVEGGYTDLGAINYSYKQTFDLHFGGTYDGYNDLELEVSGLTAGIVGQYPVSDSLSVYAKLGVFSWESEYQDTFKTVSNTNPELNETWSDSGSDSGTDIFYGLGAAYDLASFTIRMNFEFFESDGDKINNITLGAAYNF